MRRTCNALREDFNFGGRTRRALALRLSSQRFSDV